MAVNLAFSDLLALPLAALFGMVANRMFAFTSEPLGFTRVQSMVFGEPFVPAAVLPARLVELVAVFVEWVS